MEEGMKRAILAVIAIGFLSVSCGGGGGNIKKVQNGVFSNYDNTITVGKALENNKILKGGKWKAVEMNGRDYVTYTVRLTDTQIQELLLNLLTNDRDYENKPNYGSAKKFYNNLQRWSGAGNAEILAKVTSMSIDEVKKVFDIFKVKLDANNQIPEEPNLDRLYFNTTDLIDPYLTEIKTEQPLMSEYIRVLVCGHYSYGELKLEIENGIFTGDAKSYFVNMFGNTKYANDKKFIDSLVRARTKIYELYVKEKAEYESAKAEYDHRQKNDIEPMLTIDGYEITVSFVMNQDDTFDINMMEIYTEVTLKCFNNLKVRFNVANSENAQSILSYIYKGFTPNIF